MSKTSVYIKAILATLTAFFGTLGTALTDGQLTSAETLTIVSSALTAATLVYRVPNAGKDVLPDLPVI